MAAMGLKVLANPIALVGILITLSILISVATNLFPTIITQFVSLSTLANFSFSDFFGAGGVMIIIVSAIILLSVLGIFGIKGLAGGR